MFSAAIFPNFGFWSLEPIAHLRQLKGNCDFEEEIQVSSQYTKRKAIPETSAQNYEFVQQRCFRDYYASACKVKELEVCLAKKMKTPNERSNPSATGAQRKNLTKDVEVADELLARSVRLLEDAVATCEPALAACALFLEIECCCVDAYETVELPAAKSAAGADPLFTRSVDLKSWMASRLSNLALPAKCELQYAFEKALSNRVEKPVQLKINRKHQLGSKLWHTYGDVICESLWIAILRFQLRVTAIEEKTRTKGPVFGLEAGLNYFLPFSSELFHSGGQRMYGLGADDGSCVSQLLRSPFSDCQQDANKKARALSDLQEALTQITQILSDVEACAGIASFALANFFEPDIAPTHPKLRKCDNVLLLEKIFTLLASILRLDKFKMVSAIALLQGKSQTTSASLARYKMVTFQLGTILKSAKELGKLAKSFDNFSATNPSDLANEGLVNYVDEVFEEIEDVWIDVQNAMKGPSSQPNRNPRKRCSCNDDNVLGFSAILACHCECLYRSHSLLHEMFWGLNAPGDEPIGTEALAHLISPASTWETMRELMRKVSHKAVTRCPRCNVVKRSTLCSGGSSVRLCKHLELLLKLEEIVNSHAKGNHISLRSQGILRSEAWITELMNLPTLQETMSHHWNAEKLNQKLNSLLLHRFEAAMAQIALVEPFPALKPTCDQRILAASEPTGANERALCNLLAFLLGEVNVSIPERKLVIRATDVVSRDVIQRDLVKLCWIYYAICGGGLSALSQKSRLANATDNFPNVEFKESRKTRLDELVDSLPANIFSLAASVKCAANLNI